MNYFKSLISSQNIKNNAKGILLGNKTNLDREVLTEEGMVPRGGRKKSSCSHILVSSGIKSSKGDESSVGRNLTS